MPILLRAVLRGLLVIGLFVGMILFLRWLALRYLAKGDAKKTEKIHAINCLVYDFGLAMGDLASRIWVVPHPSKKAAGAVLTRAAAANIGLNFGKLFDPRKYLAAVIKAEIELAYQELNRALDNAQKQSSKEAIEYIADCQARLEMISSQPNPDDSITENFSTIRSIRADAKRIAEATTFDNGDTATGDNLRHDDRANTFYDVLGISREATDEEIKSAYRILAQIYHPDKYATLNEAKRRQMEEEFKTINEAYSTLSDPKQKTEYDLKL